MKALHLPVAILCAGLLSSTAIAKPAPPFPINKTQQDSSILTYYNRGDEFYSYKETTDGYLLIADSLGNFYYADENGKISAYKAHNPELRTTKEKAFLDSLNKDSIKASHYQNSSKKKRHPHGNLQFMKNESSSMLRNPSADD
ncbi:MAG: hypothetical protein M0P13_05775 [Fibrobacteraceae bacterium]|nr:hypothetical protein [Fibrobacteraceae bacterium]